MFDQLLPVDEVQADEHLRRAAARNPQFALIPVSLPLGASAFAVEHAAVVVVAFFEVDREGVESPLRSEGVVLITHVDEVILAGRRILGEECRGEGRAEV